MQKSKAGAGEGAGIHPMAQPRHFGVPCTKHIISVHVSGVVAPSRLQVLQPSNLAVVARDLDNRSSKTSNRFYSLTKLCSRQGNSGRAHVPPVRQHSGGQAIASSVERAVRAVVVALAARGYRRAAQCPCLRKPRSQRRPRRQLQHAARGGRSALQAKARDAMLQSLSLPVSYYMYL